MQKNMFFVVVLALRFIIKLRFPNDVPIKIIYINFVVLVEMAEISSFKPLGPLTNDSFSTANCRFH